MAVGPNSEMQCTPHAPPRRRFRRNNPYAGFLFHCYSRAFYEWRNRSGVHYVIYIVLFGAERKAT